MRALSLFLLNHRFLRGLLVAIIAVCLVFTWREAQRFAACWKCIFDSQHNEKIELREESVAVIFVAVGVFFESLEILARKAGRGCTVKAQHDLHHVADACATFGAFVVVCGLLIEMVNQIALVMPGDHAVIHLSQAALNIALSVGGLVMLGMIFPRLARGAADISFGAGA